MARASSTDVPPNFITIIDVASWQDYRDAKYRDRISFYEAR
jgi:hypothetical protein